MLLAGVLEEPLKVALGESASTQIMSLTSKTQAMLGHLQLGKKGCQGKWETIDVGV